MANDKIRIRMYQLGFGDCYLVSVPDGSKTRHICVDFGNVAGKGGRNAPFETIAKDIEKETNGHLDVAVMTHEHMDHMEGYYHQRKIFNRMTVDWVWMSAPSHPDYYEKYPNARPVKKLQQLTDAFHRQVGKRRIGLAPSFDTLLRNNLSNVDRVNYLRELPKKGVLYLRRGNSVRRKPFRHVKCRVMAPEKDMSVYYGRRSQQHLHHMINSLAASAGESSDDRWEFPHVKQSKRPPQLSDSDWKRLRGRIMRGSVEGIRTIDKAKNNTSLVFQLSVGERSLLFTGDAELRSWDKLVEKNQSWLKPVDFMKISHHGSHNGTPLDMLDTLLPRSRKDKAKIMVSTKRHVYGTKNPVPDESLMNELSTRGELINSDGMDEPWIDVVLDV
ncbi:MAG: hypothetical protein AB8G18_15175 [Gammaproteobacteria bacterium]